MTTDTYFPRVGGAEVHIRELKKMMETKGHDVRVYTTYMGEAEDGVCRKEWNHNWAAHFFALWKMSKDIDVIHAHFAYRLAFIAGLVAVLRRIPFYITEHGYGILDRPGTSFIYQKVHLFYRYWSLQFAKKYISTSEDLAVPARKYISEDKICIIPNGVNYSLFKNFTSSGRMRHVFPDKKIVLTVRRLVPKNGIQYLAAAFPEIALRVPNVHWIIAGDGPCRDEVEQRLKNTNTFKNVTMLGRVGNEEVADLYACADCVVFPSTAESTSISCIEAMAAGRAIVASAVGGLVELIGRDQKRGKLVNLFAHTLSDYDAPAVESIDKKRISQFASTISDILLNDRLAKDLGAEAQSYAARFDWSKITDEIISVYEQGRI